MERINWPRVRDILISIICIGIVVWAGWSILGLFVHAVVLLLLSMAVAFLVTPLVNLLNRYMPRILATAIVFLTVGAALGGLLYALIFSLISQIEYFSNNLPGYIQNLPTTYNTFINWLQQQGVPQTSISYALNQIQVQGTQFVGTVANNIVGIVLLVSDVLINILLVVFLSFYLTLDGKRIRDSLISIVPARILPHVQLFEDALNRVVGNYIRGQLTLATIIGVLAGLGCTFFKLGNYALIVGVLAFLFETIPMVGPALASIPAILISLLLPDPFPRTFYILFYFIGVQVVENNILGPRIVGHAVGLHPVASILALIIGAQLFGAFGALLATPIVAAAWVVIASLYRSIRGQSVDEVLSHRRSSWIRRRPYENHPRTHRPHPAEGDHAKAPPDPGKTVAAVRATRTTAERAGEHKETPVQVKGLTAPAQVERIDLLKPTAPPEPDTDG